MQSSSVVFPAPDGPNKMGIPGRRTIERSSSKSLSVRLRICTDTSRASAEADAGIATLVRVDCMVTQFEIDNHQGHEVSRRNPMIISWGSFVILRVLGG